LPLALEIRKEGEKENASILYRLAEKRRGKKCTLRRQVRTQVIEEREAMSRHQERKKGEGRIPGQPKKKKWGGEGGRSCRKGKFPYSLELQKCQRGRKENRSML